MAEIDVEEVKAALIRMAGGGVAGRPPPAPSGRQLNREFQDELRALTDDSQFRAYTEPLERFRVAQRKAMMARLGEQRRSQEARHGAATAARVADAIASERLAAGLLAKPQTSTFVVLDTPLLIWQLPCPDDSLFHLPWPDDIDPNPKVTPDITFKDWHIEPFNSWFKVYAQGDSGPYITKYVTYYMWENPSDSYALVNVTSGMTLTGSANVWGSPGKLAGNTADLRVEARLTPIRWTGWTDPATGEGLTQSPYPTIASKQLISLEAYGGSWFSDATPRSESFNLMERNILSVPLIPIPGRAVTMFEVGLHVFYVFWESGEGLSLFANEIDDGVILDLADEQKSHIARPGVVTLEILTPA